ncbi:NADAR domain-containing protein [Caenorhabditis elegans]|uniref:NADAR domain-containing protein n=2 Tax=Caenorhabditis elegans TaxID=6239 RepID=Q0G828_CAEEL|nr:NADAR domain-containing protein [Caenorhabditis elegans]CAL36504.1 NADAR domain-containing protein [Caenorhabditis elegans]|eukprot:NP_001254278.1 Uncharacterized protein CELE_F40F8.11 [Caenorhabditis elegans]
MAYSGSYPWNNNYYSHGQSSGNDSWAPSAQSQEQYNPVYPSLSGTPNFFSSSAQAYEAAPYYPAKSTAAKTTSKPVQKPYRRHHQRPNKAWSSGSQQFHLVTIDPSKPHEKPSVSKIAEAAPKPIFKVARGTVKTVNKRGTKGVQKMPNHRLEGNSWETNGLQNQTARGGGGGRGRGRGSGGRGRGGFNRGGRFNGAPKPSNNKDDIPYVHLPDDSPAITLNVSSENITAFHGFDSVFTTKHNFPVLIDNKIYGSCDHYYQICKVTDLTGVSSDKLNRGVRDENGKPIVETIEDAEKKSHSALAKDIIKAANISKEKVDEWRNSKGLETIQKALHAKVTQSAHLREALKESGDNILVHAFARDSIYGTGCTIPAIKKWLDDLSKAGVKHLKIPATFPLNKTTVQHCPVFAQGRNVLGVILMQLRQKISSGEIQVVDMSRIFNALRVNNAPAEPMDTSSKFGFISDTKSIGTF